MHIIKGLAGVIDFYESNGQIIARKWPKKSRPAPGTGSWATARQFSRITKATQTYNEVMRQTLRNMADEQPMALNDVAVSLSYGHTAKNLVTMPDATRVEINDTSQQRPPSQIPEDDPDGEIWHVTEICAVGTATGGRVRLTVDKPGNYGVFESIRAPIYHPRMKKVRGVTRQCGWEISWWYPIVAIRTCFNMDDLHKEHWSLIGQFVTNGIRFYQPFKSQDFPAPAPHSLGPIYCTYTKRVKLFDVDWNLPLFLWVSASQEPPPAPIDPDGEMASGMPQCRFYP